MQSVPIKNYKEQTGFQFHSTSIAIQQKSNEDSFSKLNNIYKTKYQKGKIMKGEKNHRKNYPHLGKKLN
jgi:hypothetical protein